ARSAPVILVVDDYEASRYLLAVTLKRAGYATVEAATGEDALKHARDMPDAVLLDVLLPDMLGFEVCQRLKRDPVTASIPVIQLSASFTSATDKVEGLQGGADSYLFAPVDPEELLATLGRLLRTQASARKQSNLLDAERAIRTELERANALLREQAFILRNVHDSIIVTDLEGRITHWNHGAEQLFGYTSREMLGEPTARIYPGQASDDPAADLARIRAGLDFQGEWRGRRKDGTEVWVDIRTTLLRGDAGEDVGFLGVAKDITERRRVREELRRRAEFEQQLIGIVSHDLRNPLSVMLLAASVLQRREDLDERAHAHLARIVSSGERATRMIRDLLDFTQARLGGGIRLERGPTDLHAVVRDVVEDLRVSHAQREVRLELSGEGRGVWDGDRMAQVLTNLLSNALAYSPATLPVTVRAGSSDAQWHVSVHNGGEPIPPHLQATLFEPMRRGPSASGGASSRSIGLGLYIVHHIVDAHGGTVALDSSAEAGTTFTVRLPRQEPTPEGP
ncbi:PAS domain S-box protein, partial [Pyxidicoccus fallax]